MSFSCALRGGTKPCYVFIYYILYQYISSINENKEYLTQNLYMFGLTQRNKLRNFDPYNSFFQILTATIN